MQTELTFLVEDQPSDGLKNEHGLSIFIKTGESFFVFDTGQSGAFAINAEKLGIGLDKADFAVVSHAHYDHGGGLPAFFRDNGAAPVYIHEKSALDVYFSTSRGGTPRYIGIDQRVFAEHKERFRFINSRVSPAEGIHFICCSEISERGPVFKDDSLFLLTGKDVTEETFDHEIYAVIENENEFILISGCSHNSITSIIKHAMMLFPDKTLRAVIGGFHMPDLKDFTAAHEKAVLQTAEELNAIAHLKNVTKQSPLYLTGHCTGSRAKLLLKERLGHNIDFFHAGSRYIF